MVGAEPLEVVSEGDEAELRSGFIDTSEIEPSEPLVLFDIPEYRFYLPSLFPLFDPLVTV